MNKQCWYVMVVASCLFGPYRDMGAMPPKKHNKSAKQTQTTSQKKQEAQTTSAPQDFEEQIEELKKNIASLKKGSGYTTKGYPLVSKLARLYAQEGTTTYALDALYQCFVDKLYGKNIVAREELADMAYEYYYAWRRKTNLLDYVYDEESDDHIAWASTVLDSCRAFMLKQDGSNLFARPSKWLSRKHDSVSLLKDPDFLQARELAVKSKTEHPDQQTINNMLFQCIHYDVTFLQSYKSEIPFSFIQAYVDNIQQFGQALDDFDSILPKKMSDTVIYRAMTEQALFALGFLHGITQQAWTELIQAQQKKSEFKKLFELSQHFVEARRLQNELIARLKSAYDQKMDLYLRQKLEAKWLGTFGEEYTRIMGSLSMEEQEFSSEKHLFIQKSIAGVTYAEAVKLLDTMKSCFSEEEYVKYKNDIELFNEFRKNQIIKRIQIERGIAMGTVHDLPYFFDKTDNPYLKFHFLTDFLERSNTSFEYYNERYAQLKSLIEDDEDVLFEAREETRKQIYFFLLKYCTMLLEKTNEPQSLQTAFSVYETMKLCGVSSDEAYSTFAQLFLSTFDAENTVKGFEFLLKAISSNTFSVDDDKMMQWLKTYSTYCFMRACDDDALSSVYKELFEKYAKSKNQVIKCIELAFYCFCGKSLQDMDHALNLLKKIDKQSKEFSKLGKLYDISFDAYLSLKIIEDEKSSQKQLSRAIDFLKNDPHLAYIVPSTYVRKASKYIDTSSKMLQHFDQCIALLKLSKEHHDLAQGDDEYRTSFESSITNALANLWDLFTHNQLEVLPFLDKAYALCHLSFDDPCCKFLQIAYNTVHYYYRTSGEEQSFIQHPSLKTHFERYYKELKAQLGESDHDIQDLLEQVMQDITAYEVKKAQSCVAHLMSVILGIEHGCSATNNDDELIAYLQKLVTTSYGLVHDIHPLEAFKATTALFFAVLYAHHDKACGYAVMQALCSCEHKKMLKRAQVRQELGQKLDELRSALHNLIVKIKAPVHGCEQELQDIALEKIEERLLGTIKNSCNARDQRLVQKLATTLEKTVLRGSDQKEKDCHVQAPVVAEALCEPQQVQQELEKTQAAQQCEMYVVPQAYALWNQVADALKKPSDKTVYSKLHTLALKLDEIAQQEQSFKGCKAQAALGVRESYEKLMTYLTSQTCTFEQVEHFVNSLIFASCGNVLNRAHISDDADEKLLFNSLMNDYKLAQNITQPTYQALAAKARLAITLFYAPTLLSHKPLVLKVLSRIVMQDQELDEHALKEQLLAKGKAETQALYEALMLYLDTRGIKLQQKAKDIVSFSKFGRYFDEAIKRYEELRKFNVNK